MPSGDKDLLARGLELLLMSDAASQDTVTQLARMSRHWKPGVAGEQYIGLAEPALSTFAIRSCSDGPG